MTATAPPKTDAEQRADQLARDIAAIPVEALSEDAGAYGALQRSDIPPVDLRAKPPTKKKK